MDDSGPQSLFLVVSWITTAVPYSSSIIQLDNNHEYASTSEFSAHFPRLLQAPRPIWLGMASSTEDLYMLLDWPHKQQSLKDDEKDGTLPGFIFNLSSKKCKLIKPPLAPKYMGHAVMLGDHVYFMAQPHYSVPNSPDPCFERYDTLSQKWEKLAHLPLYTGFIEGTAVLDDTILFYINSTTSPKTLQAYNVGRNKWYPVNVLNNLCYSLVGVAVVLNQFIYGLVRESVVALTLKSQEKDGDLVFTCDLHKEYKVPGMRQKIFEGWRDSDHWTQCFVHLGKDNFCLVQSGNCSGVVEFQCIQLTHIELTEKNTESVVTNIFVHELKIPRGGLFMIRHCFFVPKCKTTAALKQGNGFLKFNPEQEAEIVTLPPELLPFQDGYSSQTNIIDKQGGSVVPKKSSASLVTGNQSLNDATKASTLGDDGESGRSHTFEEGHSIWVTNLPHDANLELQLYKRLKRFGPIRNLVCQIDPDNTNDFLAHVEFESKTSKHKAIKASAIKVGGRKAVIKKKRGTGLTQGGSVSQTSQSRDDADTKTLQVQEDVPKKSSASVVTGRQSVNYATKASTLGDGHSICVTNLPPDANCWELFKGLMRFGPIKSFQFLINPNNPSESFADVEFGSATSKQKAMKAPIIKFGGRKAVIEEKRGTCLTQGGSVSQTSQSRDDADTKIPQVQEDVPKKSVVAGKSNVPSKASTVTGRQSLNDATKASTLGDGGESGRSHTGEEGHSIWVTNLPRDANPLQLQLQLYNRLKRFGCIKHISCKDDPDNTGECCLANVEFESATSKQNAIKESTLEIGNRLAVIVEKIGTGLSQGDSNRRSSSKTSRNKLKKRGKVSRSKKTS